MKKNVVVPHAMPRHKSLVAGVEKHLAHTLVRSYRALLFLLAAGIFLFSCDQGSDPVPAEPVTLIPDDVTKLFEEKGNTSSTKAILYSIGGPLEKLDTGYFNAFDLSEFHEVYVHQANTYNQEIIVGLNKDLTFERAIRENQVSADMLYKVAKHFKDRGKEVYIVGHSFGALIIPLLIANKKNTATKYLIMAGRLDFPDIIWQEFRDRQGYFFPDGVTPTPRDFPADVPEKETQEQYARMRLQAALAKNRYTQLLNDKDLSNVIYAYGGKDTVVGSLTAEEVKFLKDHKATVYPIVDGGHASMREPSHKGKLKTLLLAN